MKLAAYVLAADPAWIECSVNSYYDLVTRIVVSYDRRHIGWTGVPIESEECLSRLRAIDRDSKMVFCPGDFSFPDRPAMECDTYQRQCALEEASHDVDWILQLDTDEVAADATALVSSLEECDAKGFAAMEYPARWLYQQIGPGRFLEGCTRSWGVAASYPGPVAVRVGTRLKNARQCDASAFRVDFKPRNTDPSHPPDAPVHRVVRASQAIIHYSWVRDPAKMWAKSESSSHVRDFVWAPMIRHWEWAGRHPYLAALTGPFRKRSQTKQLRIVRINSGGACR